MRQLRALIVIGALVLAGQAAVSKSKAPTSYKARRGDTLSTIARRFHTTVAVLADANGLPDPNRIRAGQVISLVPKPKPAAKPAMNPIAAHKPVEAAMSDERIVLAADGASTYVVVKGDNLAKIATRFGTTVADLAKRNNLKPKKPLRIGTALQVPGGTWACPVNGPRNFSDSWRQPRAAGRQHMGTDVFAARGTPIVAPVAGRLELRRGSIGGNAFYLYGADGVTYYGAHLDAITAKAGQLKAGDQIGTVGTTGNADGGSPHLHFEIHPKGVAVDPYPTLKRWC